MTQDSKKAKVQSKDIQQSLSKKKLKKIGQITTGEVVTPEEFAASLRQFSLQYLPEMTPEQLQMDQRKKGQRGALDSHIDAQEKLKQFVVLDLLRQENPKNMQKTFDFYLKVLEESIKNNDFQSAATLLGALKSPSILRLRKEEIILAKVGEPPKVIDAGDNKCIKLNNEQIELLCDAELLFSGSNIFENYRKKLNELRAQDKPFVPMTSTIQQVYAQALGGSKTYKEADIDSDLSRDKESARKQIAEAKQDTALITILNDFQVIDKFDSFSDKRSSDILPRGQDAPLVFKETRPFHKTAKQPEMVSQMNSLFQIQKLKKTQIQNSSDQSSKKTTRIEKNSATPISEISLLVKPIGNFAIYSDPIEQLMSGWKQSTAAEQQPYTTKEFDDIATALIFKMPAQEIIDRLAAIRTRAQAEDGHLQLTTADDQLNFISQTMMLIGSIAKIYPDAFTECKFDALTRNSNLSEHAIHAVIKASTHKIQPIEMTVIPNPLTIDDYLSTKVIDKPETARAMAQDLFRSNLKLMTQIQPQEWINQNWTRGKSPNISAMADCFNGLEAMVRQDILFARSEKHQDRIFRFYIEVLDQALANHDYLSAYAIGASLQHTSISRLTYLGNDKRSTEVLEKFRILSNPTENKKAYNTELMSLGNTAYVPNISFLLQTFTFIDDGNPDNLKIGDSEYTNLIKISMDGREINNFQKQQAAAQAYLATLPANKPILTTDVSTRITNPYLDAEEAEKQSLAVKPRGEGAQPTFSQERIDLLQSSIPSMATVKKALTDHISKRIQECENINQAPEFIEAKSKGKHLKFSHKINSQGEIELSFEALTLSHLKTIQGGHFSKLFAKELKDEGYSISDADLQAGKVILKGTDVVKFLNAAGVTAADITLAYEGKGFDPSILSKPPMTHSTGASTAALESIAQEELEQEIDNDADELFSVKKSDLGVTIDVPSIETIFPSEEEEAPTEEEEAKAETKIEGRPRRGDDVSRQPPRPNTDILPQPKAEELEQGMDNDADELFSVIDTTHTIKESLSEEEQSEAEETEVRPRAMNPESPPVFVDPAITKRTHILKEFAATEESYLKNLSYIADNEKAIHNIIEKSPYMSEEQKKTYKEFISILTSIHTANQNILIDLESLKDLYDAKPINAKEIQETIERIQKNMTIIVPFYGRHAELFSKVNTPEFLDAFKQVTNPKAVPEQQDSTAKNINKVLTIAGSSLNCFDIGITPIQRYPRYCLLTQDLLKNTSEAHPAYTATSELLDAVLKSADKINTFVKARERVNNIGQFLAIKADNPKLDSKKTLKIEFVDLPIATSSTTLFEQLKDIQNSGEHPIHFELQENKDIAKNSIRIYLDPHKEAIATISILKETAASNPKIIIETKKNNLSYDALEVINGIANYLEDEFKKSPTFTSKDPELVKLYTLLNDSKAHTVELASPATQDSSIAANDPLDPDEKEEMQKLADVLTVQYTEPKDKSKKSTSPHVAILNPESKSSLRTTPLSSLMDEEPPLTVSLEDQPTSHVLTSVSKMTADPIPLETDPSVIPIDESLLVNNEEAEEEVVDAETTFDMPSTSKAPSILPPPLPIGAVVKELQSLEGEALDAAITKHLANMNAIFTNQKMPMPAHDTSKSTAEIGKLYLDALEAKQKENDSPILKGHIQLLSKILEIQKEKAAALSSEKATHRVDETPPIISRPRAHSMPSSTTSEPSIERKRAASFSGDTTPIWKKPPSSMSDKPSDKKSDTPIVPQNPSTFTNDSTKAKTKRPLGNVTIGEQRIKAQTHAQTDTIASQVIDPHSDAKVDPSTVTSQVVEPRSDAKADPPTVISQVVEPRSDDRTDSPTVISQSDTTVSVEPKGEPKSPPSRRETPLLQQKIGFPPMVSDEFGQSQNLSLQKLHDFAQAHQKAFDIKEIKKFPEQQNEGLKGLEFVFQRDKSDSKPVSAYATTGENQNVKFSVSKSLFTHDQDAAQEAIWKMCRLAVNAAEPNAVFTIPEKMSPPEKREMVKACFERAIQEALEKPDTKFTTETIPKVVDKAAEDPRKDTRLKGG
ncbi:hypothetical protein CC99x_002360 [Candidatus Berkiella cookevillensis]|uniref:RasGEF domain protein n=1 Tax=Candidatus Berkiella cookevillensis TaxID=437022 RepID=A0A0Q9YMS1_9GAMM|nr:RasGEF domain-containing protein [Candidatus Berkiella cookevillensis]MCS5707742.1 hypothetical protein [Candidatus Berkiella cookevillensis]